MIRVAIVDDHPATAEGLAALLGAQPGIKVVGTAGTLSGAAEIIECAGPDVVLLDILLGGRPEGFEVLRLQPKMARPAIVLLSSFDTAGFHARAVELGARGFLPKTSSVAEIATAVRVVAGGGTAFKASALGDAVHAPRSPSGRELAVISFLAAGLSNEEIGGRLEIAEKSVESHLRRLFARYGVATRTELSMLAVQEGWVDPGALPRRESSAPRRPSRGAGNPAGD